MLQNHMLSTIPSTFPNHIACFGVTTYTPKKVSKQAFLEYFNSFHSMTHFKTSFAPFALWRVGPDWFQIPFSPPLKSNKVKVFEVFPEFFSNQFGLSQCLPNKNLATDDGYIYISKTYSTKNSMMFFWDWKIISLTSNWFLLNLLSLNQKLLKCGEVRTWRKSNPLLSPTGQCFLGERVLLLGWREKVIF